ncbi:ankyrin repeat domain-containing protein [Gemmatimonas sp.]|uniref:ankyrin repeat domain-containing protein n=1 Tax=Gemmatimonas sp. TaxID=1962908 RepID=UPI00286E1BBF|nr:ankyrin repeat domain-containing protein [Gemmatimonas sp.]
MSMLLSLVLAFFTTTKLNGGIDFRADGTAIAPTRFEQFLHGWWLTFFSTSMFFAADHILVHTWTRWRLGQHVIEIGQQAHNPFAIMPYLALGGMGLWIIVTVLRLPGSYRATKGRSRYQWEFLVAAIAAMAMYMVPRSFLHHATLAAVGPGAHAGALLSYAAATGDQRTIDQLIARGATIDTRTPSGQAALQSAINGNRTEIVRFLLAPGANVNATTSGDTLLLTSAAANSNEAIGHMLLARGAALPCARWNVKQWERYAASRDRLQSGFTDTDSVGRRYAVRSDSVTAAWAAAFGRVPSPCD